MTSAHARDDDWDDDWDDLLAERAAARNELVRALAALDARMRDPLRIKETIRRHPLVAAGVAAGAGALLVRAFIPSGGRDTRAGDGPEGPPAPSLLDEWSDAAIRAAGPLLARFVQDQLLAAAETAERYGPEGDGRRTGATTSVP